VRAGLTQARFPGEIEVVARSYIAVATGLPIDEIDMRHHRPADRRPSRFPATLRRLGILEECFDHQAAEFHRIGEQIRREKPNCENWQSPSRGSGAGRSVRGTSRSPGRTLDTSDRVELRDRFAMILRDLEIRFRQLLPPGSANKLAQLTSA
jgi:hypothetical protein